MQTEPAHGFFSLDHLLDARPLLLERNRCLKGDHAWQCWCPHCTGSILFLYREHPDTLPAPARQRVQAAAETARAADAARRITAGERGPAAA